MPYKNKELRKAFDANRPFRSKTKTEFRKSQRQRRIKYVSREYVKLLIMADSHIQRSDIPDALIQAKQAHVKLKRLLWGRQ